MTFPTQGEWWYNSHSSGSVMSADPKHYICWKKKSPALESVLAFLSCLLSPERLTQGFAHFGTYIWLYRIHGRTAVVYIILLFVAFSQMIVQWKTDITERTFPDRNGTLQESRTYFTQTVIKEETVATVNTFHPQGSWSTLQIETECAQNCC